MIRLLDQFLIAVPQVFDEGNVGGLKYLNAAHYVDKERDRYERKIRKGIIYKRPMGFTNENHMPIDLGMPPYRLYISHYDIQKQVNQGTNWANEKYHPGLKEDYDYLTRADYGKLISAQDGDEVYFHPSVTEPENFFAIIDGQEIYRAQVHEIIFAAGKTQGFHVMVEPHIKDSTQAGLQISIDDEHKLLEGTVKYCRENGPVAAGEFVYFQADSEWEFEINGEKLFVMLEENLLMKNEEVVH